MSNKNTPTQSRLNALTPRAALRATPATTTPRSELRKRIISHTHQQQLQQNERNCKSQALEDDVTGSDVQLLNTAFRKTSVTPSTPRFKPKSTILNACYTPSSLYRNTKSAVVTPLKAPTSSTRKLTKTPTSRLSNADENNTEISNLTVAVRVRPLNAQECTRASVTNVIRVHGNELTVQAGTTADASAGLTHSFTYDHVFYSCDPESRQYACQEAVFAGTARPLIERAFEGYNACLFAYGQTGSGKSYSMMGIEALDDAALDGSAPHPEAGIIPRFCHELFNRIEAVKHKLQAEIEVSYFEIYNEKIHDLLCVAQADLSSGSLNTCATGGTPMQMRQALKVREHPIWGPYVVDLSVHPVDSYEALRNWLAVGNSQRATAATGMNDKSSRSHSIFNIVLNLTELCDSASSPSSDSDNNILHKQQEKQTLRQTRRSKISLVDLAGSERICSSGTNGDRMREGVSINKSLLTLGKVIAALGSDAKKSNGNCTPFVPYRESVLTWLLRESLGGNSRTCMLATISPASIHIEETLATLRYACQARTIVNRVKVNESPHDKIIRELRAEVDRLKSLRNEYERQRRLSANAGISNPTPRKIIIETSVDESEVEALRQQLSERERELARAQKSWMERLREAEDLRKSELRLLRRKGLALELSAEQKQACLVNLTADPILSGTLFYILPPGKVKIGRTRTSQYCSQPDIVLDGPLVAYHHCIIENEGGQLFITPENNDFETYLNGELIDGRQQMFHGDRLVIGGSHYFRISNPFCSKRDKNAVVDFQLAHQEILHKQEEKLRRELEEEKRAALSRIEMERIENERTYNERLEQLELEQLKFKCNREILETERKALVEESIKASAGSTPYTPSLALKSTLLDDINRIMQNPSEESLHKTQLMVKEATQRCRSLGLKYEFRQTKVLDEFGMFRTVVLILDKANGMKAEWPTARLGVWLDMIRDAEVLQLNAENIFSSVDIEWEPLECNGNETLNESLNSSRISLNLSIVKDVMLKQSTRALGGDSPPSSSPNNSQEQRSSTRKLKLHQRQQQQQLTKSALLNSCNASANICSSLLNMPSSTSLQLHTKKMLTYDDDDDDNNDNNGDNNAKKSSCVKSLIFSNAIHSNSNKKDNFITTAAAHVHDMQRSALKLKRLCEHRTKKNATTTYSSEQENISPLLQMTLHESLEQLEHILHSMCSSLEQSHLTANGDGVKEISPTKTPKSVRFLID